MDESDKEFKLTRESIGFPFHENTDKDGHFVAFDHEGYVSEVRFSKDDGSKILLLTIDRKRKEVRFSEIDHYPNRNDAVDGCGAEAFIQIALDKIEVCQLGFCCEFCGKSQQEVRRLVMGPTVAICNECVSLCSDIIAE